VQSCEVTHGERGSVTRVVTRGQANCAKELGCRVKADDGGLSALGLTHNID